MRFNCQTRISQPPPVRMRDEELSRSEGGVDGGEEEEREWKEVEEVFLLFNIHLLESLLVVIQ